ncbi:MAG TPA: hypothetical protein VF378_12305 [Geothrix sp.]
MLKTRALVGWLTLTILIGCTPPVTTGITAYAQADAGARKRFVLQGPDPRFPGGDPRWPVFSQILTRALVAKGFVPDATAPEVIIRVTYRVGDTQTYTFTTTTPAPTDANGVPVGPPTESTSTSESTMRAIQLEALDPASILAGKPLVLWRTHAISRGADDDLAVAFPAMVASMEEYFAGTATIMVKVDKKKSDPETQRLALP